MADFLDVAPLNQVLQDTGNCVTVASKDVAVFNVGGTIYAIEDSCLQKGASVGTGRIDGQVVKRRSHG